ncbi:hypothetical protein HJC23_010362 [Cyclotella cryptica]|uniref:Uncharacterized protein n=1 Tax=Cyclotella cryptica TaxID=29204 RepID=A0ABD3NE35_9STRA
MSYLDSGEFSRFWSRSRAFQSNLCCASVFLLDDDLINNYVEEVRVSRPYNALKLFRIFVGYESGNFFTN